jgi:multidrug efflux pump subunit AcrA (membrane-fusion protein)
MQHRFNHYRDTLTTQSPVIYRRVVTDIRRRPLFNFGIALVLLFLVLLANSILTKPAAEVKKVNTAKQVKVYSIGVAPKVTLQGKVDKTNVIKILAQAPGVVSSVDVTEGDDVSKGQTLVNLSSNYQGDSAPAVQASIAQTSYNNAVATYGTQKDVINKQRDVANTTSDNTEALRKISVESRDSTQRLIDDTQSNINALTTTINSLSTSTTPADQAQVASARQLRSQLNASLTQLQSGVNQLNYSTDTNNPPSKLAGLQKDLTLKGLDLQEKALDLGKEVSRLQASLAWIGASVMTPATPVNGKVDRVFVSVGQTVTPGTVLATIVGTEEDPTISVSLPRDLAQSLSRIEPSVIHLGNKIYSTTPRYVSSEAVDGTQNVALFYLPPQYASDVTADGFVSVDLPIGLPSTSSTIPFVPLDAVYQTANSANVYTAQDGKVISKTVTLGSVYGDYTEITSGLTSGDQVILNRNVVAGDAITLSK